MDEMRPRKAAKSTSAMLKSIKPGTQLHVARFVRSAGFAAPVLNTIPIYRKAEDRSQIGCQEHEGVRL